MPMQIRTGGEGIVPTSLHPRRYKGVGGQHHTPAALPPGKASYPLCRRKDGPHGWSVGAWKISPLPGFDPWTVQPLVSRHTDRAVLAAIVKMDITNYKYTSDNKPVGKTATVLMWFKILMKMLLPVPTTGFLENLECPIFIRVIHVCA